MKLADFDYTLPPELIAQSPLKERSESRLMILNQNSILHRHFKDIIDYFTQDDVLVLNNTKVIPARLFGRKKTGGKIEVLLITKKSTKEWSCLIKGKNINKGTEISFTTGIKGTILSKDNYNIKITFNKNIDSWLEKNGQMPTPPYIKEKLTDTSRYNTVFAEKLGSIAAPTAGLHFTPELLEKIRAKGVHIVFITLHAGLGTFLSVKEQNIENHHMHSEFFEISKKTAAIINTRKRKLFICGTTALRCLESACDKNGRIIPKSGFTHLFVYPPYKFKLSFDGIITNFHLPKSTLFMLISVIVGREKLLETYQTAIQEKYRFFSFGDAMLALK